MLAIEVTATAVTNGLVNKRPTNTAEMTLIELIIIKNCKTLSLISLSDFTAVRDIRSEVEKY